MHGVPAPAALATVGSSSSYCRASAEYLILQSNVLLTAVSDSVTHESCQYSEYSVLALSSLLAMPSSIFFIGSFRGSSGSDDAPGSSSASACGGGPGSRRLSRVTVTH